MNPALRSLSTGLMLRWLNAGHAPQSDVGHQGDVSVAVNGLPIRRHHSTAVDIGVEHHPQIRTVICNHAASRLHGLLVFRVGDVVREAAVPVQELTACSITSGTLIHTSVEHIVTPHRPRSGISPLFNTQ